MMKMFLFWQRWLLAVSVLIAVFGLVMALLNGTSIFDLFNDRIDPVFWGTEELDSAAVTFQRWVYGAWGATVSGWGIFIGFIAHYAYRDREIWACNCLVLGLGLWFVVDTAISVFYSVNFNSIFKIILMLLVALPLVFTWKSFDRHSSISEKSAPNNSLHLTPTRLDLAIW